MSAQAALWVVFHLVVAGLIALDLGVLTRTPHVLSTREAGLRSLAWVLLALLFNAGVWWARGPHDGLAFFTGYLLEEALSVDNIFVFLLIFRHFAVPPRLQPKVLNWGILGAVVMRAAFIATGVTLLHTIHWIVYVFGGLIMWAGFRMLRAPESAPAAERLAAMRALGARIAPEAEAADALVLRRGGRLYATRLLLVLVVIEITDLVFAIDSIPAILAVTTDPFLAYTSNVFAILGLRSLYFLLAGVMHLFRYLKTGLAIVLMLVGLKMLLSGIVAIPVGAMLGLVGSILGLSVAASLFYRPRGAGVLQ